MLPTSFRVTVLSASTPASPPGPGSGTALVTKTRSPQTTGLEWPRPGIGVFQATFVPAVTSQVSGGWPAGFDAARVRAAERGPALGVRGGGQTEERGAEQDGGDGSGIEVCGHAATMVRRPRRRNRIRANGSSRRANRSVMPGERFRLPIRLPMLLPT